MLSIFSGIKITLEWSSPPFLDLPPLPPLLCLTHPLILKFFHPLPPIVQYFEISISPICMWEGSNHAPLRPLSTLCDLPSQYFGLDMSELSIRY